MIWNTAVAMEKEPAGINSYRLELIAILILIVSIYAAYHQAIATGFIYLDDDQYVTDNPFVKSGLNARSIEYAFKTFHGSTWIPLTWISLMVDCELYNLNAGGYHLTNLLLHIGSSILLFLFFSRIVRLPWHGLVIAFIFAVHPLRVESVVWITERKDVLSAFFWMAAMFAYGLYVRSPTVLRYITVCLLFMTGLTAKPMVVTLPFVFLLLDVWPFKRWRDPWGFSDDNGMNHYNEIKKTGMPRLIVEKIPLFLCTFIVTWIGFLALDQQDKTTGNIFPLKIKIANAVISYVTYIKKMIIPNELSVFYPLNVSDYSPGSTAAAFSLLLLITIVSVKAFRNHRQLAIGWFWYLGTLTPVIGFRQLGYHSMADRFTYIPHIGISIMVVFSIGKLAYRIPRARALIAAVSVLTFLTLIFATYIQTSYWKTNKSLFTQALENTSNNFIAHNSLGLALLEEGDYEGAIRHFLLSLDLNEDFGRARVNLGQAYLKNNEYGKAAACFKKVIAMYPSRTEAMVNLGTMYLSRGKTGEAIDLFAEAIDKNPNSSIAHTNMGLALLRTGAMFKAINHFQKACSVDPYNADAKKNLIIATELGKQISSVVWQIDRLLMNINSQALHINHCETLDKLKKQLNNTIDSLKKGLSTQNGFNSTEFNVRNMMGMNELLNRYDKAMSACANTMGD